MTTAPDPIDEALIERILAEYKEMPGLALTTEEAQKFWGCDGTTCRIAVDFLVAHGALHWSRDGRLLSGSQGSARVAKVISRAQDD